MTEILSKSHTEGVIEQKYNYKIADSSESGLLTAVKENASAIFWALHQEYGQYTSVKDMVDDFIPFLLDTATTSNKDKVQKQITNALRHISFLEGLDAVTPKILELGANGSQEEQRLREAYTLSSQNREVWKTKLAEFQARLDAV